MRGRATIGLLAAIPYLLLLQSNDVRLMTSVGRDGSGERLFWCQGNAARLKEVQRWLGEATPGYQVQQVHQTSDQFTMSRSWRTNSLAKVPDATLKVTDFAQNPLSLYSTYTWQEKVTFSSARTTKGERMGAPAAKMTYILEMPGTIQQASVSPGGAAVEGGKASWILTADEPSYTIQATSRKLRWDLILIALFIVGAIVYKIAEIASRRVRSRPNRI